MLNARFDPRPGGRLRGALMFLPTLLWAFAHMLVMLVCSYVLRDFAGKRSAALVRTWGHVQLRLFGIRCELVNMQRLAEAGPRIVTFNHQSLLDMALLAVSWPDDGCILYKQEFHRIPIMGRLLRRMDMIPIDRGNREAAIQSIREAARRVRERGVKVFIAPEGTRSRLGRLAPFKRGPFYLAVETHVPLLPLVMHGVRELWPHDTFIPRTGRVRVEILPACDTSNWSVDTLDAHVQTLRDTYLAALPDPA
ncbi:MAG: hypothetical protein DHS20C15_07980 [Planctomycetota bacterium]|nr:MAG: hypothetical protein DHS20C15_07980 [Planctomycetota bacterium]